MSRVIYDVILLKISTNEAIKLLRER